MKCSVYKGERRQDSYLFVPAEHELSQVPKALLDMLGTLSLVLTMDLTPTTKLAQADPASVFEKLKIHGYFLQLPPGDPVH
ncbi:MAG: YcgL domain-containing protein [Gammaproteobacteria bacterium]|nr:YcgL domain-containing protein [Gammaproteobacteria bacterium]MDH3464499.1 YcgL domain-containing protein [Gammaproteobacteria bacterium]